MKTNTIQKQYKKSHIIKHIMQLRNRNVVSSTTTVSPNTVYTKPAKRVSIRRCDMKPVKKSPVPIVNMKTDHRMMQLRNRCVELSF